MYCKHFQLCDDQWVNCFLELFKIIFTFNFIKSFYKSIDLKLPKSNHNNSLIYIVILYFCCTYMVSEQYNIWHIWYYRISFNFKWTFGPIHLNSYTCWSEYLYLLVLITLFQSKKIVMNCSICIYFLTYIRFLAKWRNVLVNIIVIYSNILNGRIVNRYIK